MDGLIPMVYRAVKKNLTRRRYERLSSSSRTTRESYDMEMNVDGQHRRRWCIGDNSSLSSRETKRRAVGAMEKGCSPPHEGHQLVRFKNHRLFSCITGFIKFSLRLTTCGIFSTTRANSSGSILRFKLKRILFFRHLGLYQAIYIWFNSLLEVVPDDISTLIQHPSHDFLADGNEVIYKRFDHGSNPHSQKISTIGTNVPRTRNQCLPKKQPMCSSFLRA
ncbi:Uncharacterized protein Rs2_46466 [Raphanus sativus]|nr:Uncharacterized protein Rs2_46466 [Raphanus sativus]